VPTDTGQSTSYALAFETSGAIGSVAIGQGADVLETRAFTRPLRHANEFLPTVDALCRTYAVEPARIGMIHVSIGPGSFTGLRIGVTAARMLALAAERGGRAPVRITAIPTLEVIAQNALRSAEPAPHVAVVLDAKRGRVYGALFALRNDAYVPVCDAAEVDPSRFLSACPPDTAVLGDGVRVHRVVVEASGRVTLPESLFAAEAETTYRLGMRRAERGGAVAPRDLVPLYVRPPEAEERWLMRNRNS
jgi:tRNA threonylcarbamoyladenosine biosynthesis protein TsaB